MRPLEHTGSHSHGKGFLMDKADNNKKADKSDDF